MTLTVDDVQAYKPHRDPYLYAARTLGLPPAALVLVAAPQLGRRRRTGGRPVRRLDRPPRADLAVPDGRAAFGEHPRRGGRASSRQTRVEVEQNGFAAANRESGSHRSKETNPRHEARRSASIFISRSQVAIDLREVATLQRYQRDTWVAGPTRIEASQAVGGVG